MRRYRWDRWLDGPDLNDPDTPDENPGAAVVTALTDGEADWAIVTNGKFWRLYSKEAHSRSTNFYEVDLEEALSVDANKLTDVNLLKRHVLKRCIYGVDLNPMAVELAKVSLWLDAFTLGAPLSFLDHHLRCGNSLIGATFDVLKKATEGQLFSIDYQPLLKAIEHVLLVNKMADATASEVHESVQRYGDARKALSGYKIVFDLLVADYFLDQSRDREGVN